jgi:hypothetical protein
MRASLLGLLLLVGLVAAGCGAAMQQAAAPASSHTTRTPSPFVTRNATQASGGPVVTAGKTGVSLRALPGGKFGLLVVLKNQTHRQLMLENVRAVVPPGSFVRQLGTHLAPYFQCKPYCSRHMVMHGPFGVERLAAIHVRPLNSAQAQLNFAFAGCGALQSASTTPITKAVVTYRDTRGMTFRQTVALRSAQLGLQSSGPIACT